MHISRRTFLGVGGLALVGLAGCLTTPSAGDGDDGSDSGTPLPDGGDDSGGTGADGDPGDDTDSGLGGDDSAAGGTRPAGTGGPGVSIVSVDDPSSLPMTTDVELVEPVATADTPPVLRVTLTNASDLPIRVGEGRAAWFAYVVDERGALQLLPADQSYPAEADCWRLTEPIAITQEYRMVDLDPGESVSQDLALYGAPGIEACLPVGEHRFETPVAVLGDGGESEERATWGFTVLLE